MRELERETGIESATICLGNTPVTSHFMEFRDDLADIHERG